MSGSWAPSCHGGLQGPEASWVIKGSPSGEKSVNRIPYILITAIKKNKKDKSTNELIYKTDMENKLMVTKGGRGWGRDKLGVWDQQIQTTIDQIDN